MIIGICGFIGSGKGAVGDILEKRGFKKDSFAAPVKDAVSVIFNWDRQMLEGATEDSRKWRESPDEFWSNAFGRTFTPREALQLMGTEVGRNTFHPDLWIQSLFKRARTQLYTVITDVRFKNEIRQIHQHEGYVIRVKRGSDPVWYSTAMLANSGNQEALLTMKEIGIHSSEWDWIGSAFDYVIENDGPMEELERKVGEFLTDIS
jgi:hypothetical protein